MILALTAAAALAASGGSQAAFNGANGKIAYSSNRTGQPEIVVADADGTNRVALNASGSAPKWSPDGSKIAFSSTRDGNSEIYVMNADGSGQTRLTNNSVYDSRPQWTADGQHLVFTRIVPPFNWEIFEMNADGTGQTDLTSSDAVEWGQATSSRGDKIVFTREDAGIGHIYTMSKNGSDVRQLTSTSSYDEYPNWSPNGNDILFTRDDGHGSDLWVIRSNGTGASQITHQSATGYVYAASWSPDGTAIAYTQCGLDAAGPCTVHTAKADGSGDVDISTPRTPFLDTFSGAGLDPFWGLPFAQGGGGVSLTQANGQLEVSVPSGATLDPSFGYISLGISSPCTVSGDFDVQVDYRLLQWPFPSDVNVGFAVNTPDFSTFYGEFVFNPGGLGTGVSTGFPGPLNTYVPDASPSGTMRLVRAGSTLTAYRLVDGAWSALQSTQAATSDMRVNMNVFSNVQPFSHADVKVAYDNFRVSSGSFTCPTWWSDNSSDWQPLPRHGS